MYHWTVAGIPQFEKPCYSVYMCTSLFPVILHGDLDTQKEVHFEYTLEITEQFSNMSVSFVYHESQCLEGNWQSISIHHILM
jgi:hypothetical protein